MEKTPFTPFANLARSRKIHVEVDPTVDKTLLQELAIANIGAIKLAGPQFEFTEVPFSYIGALCSTKTLTEYNSISRHLNTSSIESLTLEFMFQRRWYYWSVTGYVPLAVAEEMYHHPDGKDKVRAGGDANSSPPSEHLLDRLVCGMQVVNAYHIDSQEGLNLFAKTMREHKLFLE